MVAEKVGLTALPIATPDPVNWAVKSAFGVNGVFTGMTQLGGPNSIYASYFNHSKAFLLPRNEKN